MAINTYEELCLAALELVALYETSHASPDCFGVVSGNDDDYGISMGAIQFTLVQAPPGFPVAYGSLPAILLNMVNNHTDVTKGVFEYDSDPSYYNTLVDVLNNYTAQEMQDWADSISTLPGKHTLIAPWQTYFETLGVTDECIQEQLTAAGWYFSTALSIYNILKEYSPLPKMFSRRFFAQCFDIAVFTGGMSSATKSAIQTAFAAISTTGKTDEEIEIEKMQIVAQKNADAESNPVLKQIKLDRSNAIANGTGYIYGGTLYMDTSVYEITMAAAFPGREQDDGYFQYYSNANRATKTHGIDVSHWQTDGSINFETAYSAGDRFAIFKVGGNYKTNFTARYIRCTVNGSYTNSSSIFNLIKIYNSSYVEVGAGKTVTGSETTPQFGYPSNSYSNFVDGSTSTYVGVGDWEQWIQVDLGASMSIAFIILYHYSGRIFKENKVEYSTNGTSWTTLFDSAVAGEYLETAGGMTIFKYGGISQDTVNFTAIHVASARAAGLKVGTYFFKNPNYIDTTNGVWMTTTADASSDASAYVGWISETLEADDYGDCFLNLDWENDQASIYPAADCSASYDYIQTFVQQVSALTNGRQCGVYTAYYTIETMTADRDLMMCKSASDLIGDVCPLWMSNSIDAVYGGDTYPKYGFEAWGQFADDRWTIWQYSHTNNNSGASHGMLAGDLDLNILEGAIETIMPPSSVALEGIGAATQINLTWTAAESDVLGYMYWLAGETTATVANTVLFTSITGLEPNTEYTIYMCSYDTWEIGTAVSITEETTGATIGLKTLWCTYLAD